MRCKVCGQINVERNPKKYFTAISHMNDDIETFIIVARRR